MKKVGQHNLDLVLAPFSNQEGEWLWKDAEIRQIARASKLYMIGQRSEIHFENFEAHAEAIGFDLVGGGKTIKNVRLPIAQFEVPAERSFACEIGKKIIRIYSVDPDTFHPNDIHKQELIHWFTPDRLFFYYSRGKVLAEGLENYRQFTEFDLYYIGISKLGDSFSRLFKTAHEKRSRILGNEAQFKPTARLSDELTIFLFTVEDMVVQTFSADDEEINFSTEPIDAGKLAADAEKAFIRILRAKYNTQTYPSYPISRDGLWDEKFDHYGFFINEALTFKTPTTAIRGARMYDSFFRSQPDFISIVGNQVNLVTPP